MSTRVPFACLIGLLSAFSGPVQAQIVPATRSGFSWIDSENVTDMSFDAGYTAYVAAWPHPSVDQTQWDDPYPRRDLACARVLYLTLDHPPRVSD